MKLLYDSLTQFQLNVIVERKSENPLKESEHRHGPSMCTLTRVIRCQEHNLALAFVLVIIEEEVKTHEPAVTCDWTRRMEGPAIKSSRPLTSSSNDWR